MPFSLILQNPFIHCIISALCKYIFAVVYMFVYIYIHVYECSGLNMSRDGAIVGHFA